MPEHDRRDGKALQAVQKGIAPSDGRSYLIQVALQLRRTSDVLAGLGPAIHRSRESFPMDTWAICAKTGFALLPTHDKRRVPKRTLTILAIPLYAVVRRS